MISFESNLVGIGTELADLKSSCQETALHLPTFGHAITVSSAGRRTVVTFISDNGFNSPAMLEMKISPESALSGLKIQRVPYQGGAKWEIFNNSTASYEMTVRAAAHGRVEVS